MKVTTMRVNLFSVFMITSLVCLLTGCAKNQASHLPPIWQWPTAAIGTAIDNGIYNSRRKKLKSYLQAHFQDIESSVMNGALWGSLSPQFQSACDIARINSDACQQLPGQLKEDAHLYFMSYTNNKELSPQQAIENLTVAFMVHGQ